MFLSAPPRRFDLYIQELKHKPEEITVVVNVSASTTYEGTTAKSSWPKP